MGPEVPLRFTSQSMDDVVRLLRDGFWDRFGALPSATTLAMAAGVIGLENGGGRNIVQNNFGNIMAGPGWGGAYWPRPTDDPQQPTRFRAYPTPVDGAIDFWRVLARQHRGVVAAMALGNPTAVTVALYRSGYVVGGNRVAYRNGVAYWARAARNAPAMGWRWVFPVGLAVTTLGARAIYSRWEQAS